jgi:hypothetical protein
LRKRVGEIDPKSLATQSAANSQRREILLILTTLAMNTPKNIHELTHKGTEAKKLRSVVKKDEPGVNAIKKFTPSLGIP